MISCIAMSLSNVILLITIIVRFSFTQRKITDGKETNDDKGYMVYLLQADQSPRKYDEWLCGGAIVTPTIIVTSAACVKDVQYMYAIAGYKTYVNYQKIDTNECTKDSKRKVVKSCVPKDYKFNFDKTEEWSEIDIATVEVDNAFDFTKIETGCSYIPKAIPINYNYKYQKPDTDVFILGWGHQEAWRQSGDTNDLNNELLVYGSTLIINKQACKESYKSTPGLERVIDKYMICTDEKGSLDDKGKLISPNEGGKANKENDGCTDRRMENCDTDMTRKSNKLSKAAHTQSPVVEEETPSSVNTKRGMEDGENDQFSEILYGSRKMINNSSSDQRTRKQGICQNDHGGPLVTWRGTEEILIGIASVFSVNEQNKCVGPYLFTSTHCNSIFLDCVINGGTNIKRMGSDGNYEYIVGSGPDPAYPDPEVEYYADEQIFDGRRDSGDFSMDEGRMAPACQISAAKLGFKFEFRRINWNDTKTRSDHYSAQIPQINDHRIIRGESMEDIIRVRPQIPLREYVANKGKSKTKP